MNNLYEAALHYQRQKLPIFPCQIRGKKPACARGLLRRHQRSRPHPIVVGADLAI